LHDIENAKGSGSTSMISLILPPGDLISRAVKMLDDELGTAAKIKSRVNRLSITAAITSTMQRLNLYHQVPENGLVVYCGMVTTSDNKERRLCIDIVPPRPINTSLYLCDGHFHTVPLRELLMTDDVYGFIIVDGNGCLFGTLCGNVRQIVHRFTVSLPNKHGRGGQSALRFARLREEKRTNYVRKVAETAANIFLGTHPVKAIVLAGLASFKTELGESAVFDQRLRRIILCKVDVAYGGESGFSQAIELASEQIGNVRIVQEQRTIAQYFDEIAMDTGKYTIGVVETLNALVETRSVETLIVWEDLDIMASSVIPDMCVSGDVPLIEWIVDRHSDFGAKLELVGNRSPKGHQFCQGFGGIGAILRFKSHDE